MNAKTKLIFEVSNMKCGGCVSAVTQALQALDSTEVVDVSLEQHQAVVLSALSAEDIAAVITSAGFPAEPI